MSEFDSHDHFDFDSVSDLDFIFDFHSDWDSIVVLNMIWMWILIQIVTLILILVVFSIQPSSLAQIKMRTSSHEEFHKTEFDPDSDCGVFIKLHCICHKNSFVSFLIFILVGIPFLF